MKFELQGRLVFEATDIADAFQKLAEHFTTLARGQDSDIPLVGTDLRVRRLGVSVPSPSIAPKKTVLRGSKKV